MAMQDPSHGGHQNDNTPNSRLTRTARAAMAVAARAREIKACLQLWDRHSTPGPSEETQRDQALRLVITALAAEHSGKAARFAQVSVPSCCVDGIAAVLGAQGYSIAAGQSYTPDYRSLTVWPTGTPIGHGKESQTDEQ